LTRPGHPFGTMLRRQGAGHPQDEDRKGPQTIMAPAGPAVGDVVGYRPSPSLVRWRTVGQAEIDELVAAHHAIGGIGPGRRTATQQINYALLVQLASQFQRYCRDLHALCADAVVSAAPPALQPALDLAFTAGRKLDRQNAHSGTLGDDFGRFGPRFWLAVDALGPQFAVRRRRLDQLNAWRNAIAHQDFRHVGTDPLTQGSRADLPTFRTWRSALDQLAGGIDRAMYRELTGIIGSGPW
jgi:hypothetical protein